MNIKNSTILSVIILFCIGGFVNIQCMQNKKSALSVKNEYVGDQTCKTCHSKEFSEWSISDHFKAMQEANDSTVLGDFNNSSYTADGITSKFFKKDGKFFINTQSEDGTYKDYEIKYTFGYYPLQQYLVAFSRGRMQVTRQSWDSRTKKWFHQYAGQKITPGDWLHWTGNAQNWNTMCAECHSTNLQKNYDFETDTYNTSFSNLTVSCESCHGPAKAHIDFIESDDYDSVNYYGSFMLMPKNSTQHAEINTCFPCHARKGNISAELLHSDQLLDNYIPEIPSTTYYQSDGQVNDEDYTYASFLQSKMYKQGVKCSNCHNPHSGKLIMIGNALCTQCHQKEKYDAPTHTFHATNTVGAECKSCHMPSKTYMGNDTRHDHIFRIPRPDLSVKNGTTNACNDCHKDKSASWSAAAIVKWFGPNRSYHFAEDLSPGSKMDKNAEAHLIKLIQDTATPAIIQATAVQYLSGINNENNLQVLMKELNHTDAQVRYRAVVGLMNFDPNKWRSAVVSLLSDKVRAVRIAAANALVSIDDPTSLQQYGDTYAQATSELKNYILYQTDFASGSVMAGDYFMKLKSYVDAEKYYLRGIQKDTAMNYARLNLATMYNLMGRNQDALKVLEAALKTDPGNDRIYYNLALLYNETGDVQKTALYLKKAIALKSSNPRVYYNYGVLLQQEQKHTEAEKWYQQALLLAPTDGDINFAICVLYLQQNMPEKAMPYAKTLKQYYPTNNQYIPLFQQLGL